MRNAKAARILAGLLYGQALLGLIAVGAVLMKDRGNDFAGIDTMTVASVKPAPTVDMPVSNR